MEELIDWDMGMGVNHPDFMDVLVPDNAPDPVNFNVAAGIANQMHGLAFGQEVAQVEVQENNNMQNGEPQAAGVENGGMQQATQGMGNGGVHNPFQAPPVLFDEPVEGHESVNHTASKSAKSINILHLMSKHWTWQEGQRDLQSRPSLADLCNTANAKEPQIQFMAPLNPVLIWLDTDSLASQKYEDALLIKPDFFETEKMQSATECGRSRRCKEAKIFKESSFRLEKNLIKRKRKQVSSSEGMMDWNKNLGPALERLKLDGTSKAKISILLKYQCLNLDAVEGNKVALLHLKKYESLSLLAIKEETLKRYVAD
ncbi:hypothetical protein ACET3Z_004671 [Daucus carota]